MIVIEFKSYSFFQNIIIDPNLVAIITGLNVGISIFLIIHIIPNIFFSENRKDKWNIGNELLISAGVMLTIFTFNYLFFKFSFSYRFFE